MALASTIPLWGAAPVDEQSRPTLSAVTIGPGYFRTPGTAVLSGRDFNQGDGPSGPRVAIVNERFARRFWPGEHPLGKRLQSDIARPELNSLVYLPWRQMWAGNMNVLVRTSPSGKSPNHSS